MGGGPTAREECLSCGLTLLPVCLSLSICQLLQLNTSRGEGGEIHNKSDQWEKRCFGGEEKIMIRLSLEFLIKSPSFPFLNK